MTAPISAMPFKTRSSTMSMMSKKKCKSDQAVAISFSLDDIDYCAEIAQTKRQ